MPSTLRHPRAHAHAHARELTPPVPAAVCLSRKVFPRLSRRPDVCVTCPSCVSRSPAMHVTPPSVRVSCMSPPGVACARTRHTCVEFSAEVLRTRPVRGPASVSPSQGLTLHRKTVEVRWTESQPGTLAPGPRPSAADMPSSASPYIPSRVLGFLQPQHVVGLSVKHSHGRGKPRHEKQDSASPTPDLSRGPPRPVPSAAMSRV